MRAEAFAVDFPDGTVFQAPFRGWQAPTGVRGLSLS